MDSVLLLKIITILIGLYMAWNIGANDVANAISTSVGSKAIKLKKAIVIAAILEFLGAYFLGSRVSQTIQTGIINPDFFSKDLMIFVLGMISALLATGIWLNLASFLKMPVSTTHAIVGSLIGFGTIIGSLKAIYWTKISFIAISWLTTPLISGIISYIVFYALQKNILFALNPIKATKKFTPVLVFLSIFFFSINLLTANNTFGFSFDIALIITTLISAFASIISIFLMKKIKYDSCPVIYHHPQHIISLKKASKHLNKTKISSYGSLNEKASKLLKEVNSLLDDVKQKNTYEMPSSEYSKVEKVFGYLQIISLCLIAFAHGANDVANAIGPVAAVMQALKTKIVFFSINHFFLDFTYRSFGNRYWSCYLGVESC